MAKKILIIEDEKMLGEMYRDKFLQAGFEVVLVDSSQKATKILPKEKPDLVLLDILLSEGNGIGFLGWLKKRSKFSSLPVVAFSNYDDPEAKEKAFELGVKDYLIKTNYTPWEIVEKVKSYLSQ